ncbi:ABC transporter substrate-binding protein [Streptomyces umbrinus]|uniref:ABC transporter substrate-binding protein n=1 Tax=Streptomyces umbrinus TaxID=67370 RepID=UPI003442C094
MTTRHYPSTIRSSLSRRGFLGLGAGTAGAALLTACGGLGPGDSGGAKTVKFWDMMWGLTGYTPVAKKLALGYKPASGRPKASYQYIPWANFVQTFSSAVASKTGPAVSSGASYQALQFLRQGAIAPADDLVATLDKKDFLPGTIEAMRYEGQYFAVPWQMDIRVLYVRKSLLEKAGVAVPTDWDSLKAACVALRKQGSAGFGMQAGPSTTVGSQQVLTMMYNNGGGMFDEDGKPDCVTDRNVETLEFLKELVSIGAIEKRYVSYTDNNLLADVKSGKAAMAFLAPGYETNLPTEDQADLVVTSPLSGPHGDKGAYASINNLMMYTTTPSQRDSEAFLTYYLDHMKVLWQKGVVTALPVRQSIVDLPEFQANANMAKIAKEWQPVGKTHAALSPTPFPALNAVDGGQALAKFTQQIIQGAGTPRSQLESLQKGIESLVK